MSATTKATKTPRAKKAAKSKVMFSTPENINEHMKGRKIFYDTETTGFNPELGDRVIEIALVEVVDAVPTGREFHQYFNPEGKEVGSSITVHGLSDDFLSDKPLFAEFASDILDFVKDAEIIAHNDSFDLKFLNAELERAGFEEKLQDVVLKTTDSIKIARRTLSHKMSKFNLDALAKVLEVDLSERQKHGALIDSRLLANIFDRMTFGANLSKPLPSEDLEREPVSYIQNRKPGILVEIAPNAAQLHESYLDGLSNPVERREAPAPSPVAKRGP